MSRKQLFTFTGVFIKDLSSSAGRSELACATTLLNIPFMKRIRAHLLSLVADTATLVFVKLKGMWTFHHWFLIFRLAITTTWVFIPIVFLWITRLGCLNTLTATLNMLFHQCRTKDIRNIPRVSSWHIDGVMFYCCHLFFARLAGH